ncbi:hypothetical protein C8R43DRAFT_1083295 [Mycena crocata]|nr:hypothetical protein C8R43DRAFT_1083295 [Mycena crocata]
MNLDHLLATNDAPTDFQLAAAVSLLKEMEIELARINTRRERLFHSIRAHKSVVSRLRSLPPEVLSLIFLAVPDPGDYCGLMLRTPWLFTTICHRWRAVALATPALWADIQINLENWTSPGREQLLRTALERSGSGPLHIDISALSTASSTEAFDLLMAASHRWKDATLNVPATLYSRMTALGIESPALEHLRMHLVFSDTSEVPHGIIGFVEAAPVLRTLQLGNDFIPNAPPFPPFCFQSITSLYCHGLEESTAVFLLHEMRAIEDCTITIVNRKFSKGLPGLPRFELPHLRSLNLNTEQPNEKDAAILRLSTPSLSTLRIGGFTRTRDVLSMLCPSRALLTKLTISTWDAVDDIVALFRELGALVEFELFHQPAPTELITALDPSSGVSSMSGPVLPCLQRLTLAGTQFDFASFVTMLTARCTCPDTQTLSFVAIANRRYLGTSQARPLRELFIVGLQMFFMDEDSHFLPLCTSDQVLRLCCDPPHFAYEFEYDDSDELDSDSDIGYGFV